MTLHYKEGSTASNTSAKRLKELVDTNGLTVTHIVSPPRTLSTILEIALAEGAHGQVNEPFHTRSRDSFEDGCSNILRRLSSIEGDDPTKRLVIKDLAKHISESEWQKLLCFIRAAIFVIREPTLQFHSLLSVRIADILRDGREAEPHDVAKMAKDLPEEAWYDSSWRKLELFLKKATQASLQIGVVSGLTLRADPDFVMHRLHQIAGHPTEGFEDRVVSGWSRHNRDHFYTVPFINQGPIHYSFTTNNPWLSSAVNSTNFIALSERRDGPISIMDYPGRMQEYLLDEVIPAFVRLLMHPKTIVGAEILTVIETLSPINPIEAYTLVHHPAVPDNKKLRRLREDLKSRLSLQHRAILNAIDMHTKSSAS